MDDKDNVKLNAEKQKEAKNKKEDDNWVFWTCIGIAIGVSLGGAFGNVGLGLAVGVAVGMAIGMIGKAKKRPK